MNRTSDAGWALLAWALVIAAACTQTEPPAEGPGQPKDRPQAPARLAEYMTGTFTSRDQAVADPDHYSDIRLVMMRIWADRESACWLYVEQASAGRFDRPYRQRVYRLCAESPGTIRSDVYTLPGDPLSYAGMWRDPALPGRLSPDDLTLREGCSIILHQSGPEEFSGSTVGLGCESALRGAAYATSVVRITPTALESWDRGFDAEHAQVWGATEGPYVFEKVSGQPPP